MSASDIAGRRFPYQRERPCDPPEILREWHDESPVNQITTWDGRTTWIATGSEECRAIFSDHETYRSDPTTPGFPTLSPADAASKNARLMPMLDPPDHDRLRRTVQGEFTVRRVNEQRLHTEAIVDELLDTLAGRNPPVDLITAFAQEVPARFTCRLLGVPITDAPFFNECLGTRFDAQSEQNSVYASDDRLRAYFEDVVTARLTEPHDDLSGRLVCDHVDTGDLTGAEAAAVLHVLLIGGFDTTRNMIAMATVLFEGQPDQLAELRADPLLWPTAVEELLRYLAIAQYERRAITADVQIGGCPMRAGDGVITALHAACRDPRAFDDPDRFDIHRDRNQHLAFGSGLHQCLGQPVARMLLLVALPRLFGRFPTLRLALPADQLKYFEGRTIWGPRELPVTW